MNGRNGTGKSAQRKGGESEQDVDMHRREIRRWGK